MERPQVEKQTIQRDITGEIVYLDQMRRLNESPTPFLELGDMAIQMYEAEADLYIANDQRPDIMNDYERYDYRPSKVVASCIALADELLTFKDPDSPLTFVDIAVESAPDTVLEKLQTIAAGSILAEQDEQLAISSDGEYYPVLDIRKQNAQLVGVGLRVWGWNDQKYIFTNKKGEQYDYPKHALVYPSNEISSTRQLELSFGYEDKNSGSFSESVSLFLRPDGSASIDRQVWAAAYAETGYEGHQGSSLRKPTNKDIAAFGDLIAEIVGDTPESVSMNVTRQLEELADSAATPIAKEAIQNLIETTWPAQANYFLNSVVDESGKTVAEQLRDEATVDEAITTINTIIKKWKALK